MGRRFGTPRHHLRRGRAHMRGHLRDGRQQGRARPSHVARILAVGPRRGRRRLDDGEPALPW